MSKNFTIKITPSKTFTGTYMDTWLAYMPSLTENRVTLWKLLTQTGHSNCNLLHFKGVSYVVKENKYRIVFFLNNFRLCTIILFEDRGFPPFLKKYSYFLCKISIFSSTTNSWLFLVAVCPHFLSHDLLHIQVSNAKWLKYYCARNLWSLSFLSSQN